MNYLVKLGVKIQEDKAKQIKSYMKDKKNLIIFLLIIIIALLVGVLIGNNTKKEIKKLDPDLKRLIGIRLLIAFVKVKKREILSNLL